LIVFYLNYERVNNGLFTLFQNRLGDLFFVIFIVGSLNLLIATSRVVYWGILFLVIGGCVKRAQFPFGSWLLAAIRAPTPISSLVHSSTLVVAGVYILLQYSYCLVDYLSILQLIRGLTMVVRGFGLLNETDIKKLIAYSTIGHVALIIFLLRYKLFKVVFFHLNVHAIFKSLIFMCFGFVILISYHGQDKRMIRYRNLNPRLKIVYYFSCLCLGGLPFLRAFFSKDLILEKIIEFYSDFFFIIILIVYLRIRVFYRIKLVSVFKVQFSLRLVEKITIGF